MRFETMAAVGLMALVATAGTVNLAHSEERLRPLGSLTYDPEPVTIQRGVYQIKQGERRIRSMRILAEEGSADVRSLKVVYTDGEFETVRVRQTLKEGERTALFKLEEVRPIKSVEVSYIPKGAVTLVFLADVRRGEAPAPVAEWVDLGCKKVGLLADRDSINVTSEDRYKALRLRSQNYDIELGEMTIRYVNGGRETYRVGQVIPAGGRIGPIQLRGDSRRISRLDFLYRARSLGPVSTRLCVEALKVGDQAEDDQNSDDEN